MYSAGFRSTHVDAWQPGFPHHLPRQQGFGHARVNRVIFVVVIVVVTITFRIECDNEAVIVALSSPIGNSSGTYESVASASC